MEGAPFRMEGGVGEGGGPVRGAPVEGAAFRPQGWARPRQWVGRVLAGLIAAGASVGVAQASGSGWVQAVGALLAGGVLAGCAAPGLVARRLTVVCVRAPRDATAGERAVFEILAARAARVRPVAQPGVPVAGGAVMAGPGGAGVPTPLAVTFERRGVYAELPVELGTAAPFGLVWWVRRGRIALGAPVHVAPRIGPPGATIRHAEGRAGDELVTVSAPSGVTRAIRRYVLGDSPRNVHWPATAHIGAVMVREREEQLDSTVTVAVRLTGEDDADERACERALGAVVQLLGGGAHQAVVLDTVEPGGVRIAPVRSRIEAGRRLARAVPGRGS